MTKGKRKSPSLRLSCIILVFSSIILTAITVRGQTETGKTITLTLPGNVKLQMVRIPAGSFEMGSLETELGRYSDEGPVHKVTIGYDFYFGKYEVTQAQWRAVMGNNPVYRCGIGDNYPVSHISWDQCQQFISKLNRLYIGSFRLPSEAEWEYACRAGTQTRFYFGNSFSGDNRCEDAEAGLLPGNRSDYMWYCGNNAAPGKPNFGAKPVGQKKPNAFGLYDMSGNVWENCQDEYHSSYKGAPDDGSAWQGDGRISRVLRGGAWDYYARKCRSAVRCGYVASKGYTFHGLRLVWVPYSRDSREWFGSWEAIAVGDNIVSYQSELGGWPKNMGWYRHGYQGEKFTKNWGNTIDNGSTYTPMKFLAKLYNTTGKKRFKESFLRGLHFLLEMQYDNGGFPQRYPPRGDYGDHITFNDGAMTGVTQLFKDILEKPEYSWLDSRHRARVNKAYEKAFQCILECQMVVDGKRTVWAQQHDPETLEPRSARAYEPPALCSRESVGVVLFLMSYKNPSEKVVKAVEAAVDWFKQSRLTGIRITRKNGRKTVVKDPHAPALWARFYDVKTNQPVFGDQNGKVYYSLDEIGKERANGYSWYGRYGEKLLEDYKTWKKRVKQP